MNKRIAQNALNFILSDRFTFTGEDLLPAVEVVRELQVFLADGNQANSEGGAPAGAGDGPHDPESS